MKTASISIDPLLEIKGLRAKFGERSEEVIKGVDIQIQAGETLGLVGESGSGKSVTAMSIARLIPSPPLIFPSGRITFQSRDILAADSVGLRSIRGQKIGVIFQEPMSALNPLKTCGAQVLEAIKEHNKSIKADLAQDEVLQLFEQVKLPDPHRAYSAYPHELSGGQLQRVVIACAVACRPDLLIADEPTTALDVTVQREILMLLRALQKDMGMAILFISHDLALIAEICDRVAVMHKGVLVEQGPTREVLAKPSHDYTRGLLESRPPTQGRPKRLRTVRDVMNGLAPTRLETSQERIERLQRITSSEVVLQGRSISIHYPVRAGVLRRVVDEVKAVQQVDFQLRRGETLGIVGESGCGKSTLSKGIMGMVPLHDGRIEMLGVDLADVSQKERARRIQMIFQDPYGSLNPRMSIGDTIMEPMRIHGLYSSAGERRDKMLSLLAEVGLEVEHHRRFPHEFSGGQRQRIGIARALAMDPEIIICDESVSALDVSVQSQVLNLLNDLKEKHGLSYIFISHDLDVVRYMSDHIMVMYEGRCQEYGESDALYESPNNNYTRHLITSRFGH